MQDGFGGYKMSPAAKRRLSRRTRISSVDMAKSLLNKMPQGAAHDLAATQVANLKRVVESGESIFGLERARRDLGFWQSLAAYLTRYPKKLSQDRRG